MSDSPPMGGGVWGGGRSNPSIEAWQHPPKPPPVSRVTVTGLPGEDGGNLGRKLP